MAATSANTITDSIVKMPAMIHTTNISVGEPSNAAISAGRIKIPEPIMVAITREIAVGSPMVR